MLTQDDLRNLLCYDPETGEWVWICKRNGVKLGQPAGTPNGEGRVQIRINGIKYYSSRLAWLYMTGKWPTKHTDHINRINSDDRWKNLRLATRGENATNRFYKKLKRPDLPRGVTEHPGGYVAKISIYGKRKHLGLFKTPEEAETAYLNASRFRLEYFPKVANDEC